MCGITGFIDHHQLINEAQLKQASATLRHRGGNGSGFIFDEKQHFTIGMANERLATIDLSPNAQQPLTSNCSQYSITFNGTIYNYLELRETLIKYGVIFSTLSDTEVILECYKKWGQRAFEKLDGSYAFALYDRQLNQLLVVRDEIGAKPLYYYRADGFYAFGSEIRALLSYPPVEKKINHEAVATFFSYGYFKNEQSIFDRICKHKKGIISIIDLHSGNSYDTPIFKSKPATLAPEPENEAAILDKIEELLTESILKRNVADVPIGVLLSGGYDSATVAAILQKNQSKRIKTFTIGFKDEKLNETPQAKKIAEYLKTNHHEFYLNPDSALQLLHQLPEVFDEPVGDSSAIALLFIAEKVKNEVKVLLGAEGGDELFGGYRTYAKAIKLDALANKKMPKAIKDLLISYLKLTQPKTKEILAADGLLTKYLAVNAAFTPEELDRLLQQPIALEQPKAKAETIKGLLLYDLHNYLPNHILTKTDRCFMHHGVDNRDAILKTELIDFLVALDPKWFMKDGQQKYLLKKITHKYIPAQLMASPKKGFVVPLANWLKTVFRPIIEKYLSHEKLDRHQLLSPAEVEKIKKTFYRNPSVYHAQKVWLLLQFQMWHERWMA
ncbi:MAG: asparagine synthase (glutamine-hydrolyzing) [Pedobacter sp.]|nr:asparagine synthase (glutamine-hydrolyzing) [Pedobacter sp.]MDQ8051413.1 asparagine synthase (glutamine-hydrolyzing) [Pedobacter sp.]